MKKHLVLFIFLLIFFKLTSSIFAEEKTFHKNYTSHQNSPDTKNKYLKKRQKLKHYHGDYVKYSSSKDCCRIRE